MGAHRKMDENGSSVVEVAGSCTAGAGAGGCACGGGGMGAVVVVTVLGWPMVLVMVPPGVVDALAEPLAWPVPEVEMKVWVWGA